MGVLSGYPSHVVDCRLITASTSSDVIIKINVCVCVCERERERKRENVCLRECVYARARISV